MALLRGEWREAAQANSRNEVCIREILVFCIKIRDIVSIWFCYRNTIYREYLDPVLKYDIFRKFGFGVKIRDIQNLRIRYKNTRYSEFSDLL